MDWQISYLSMDYWVVPYKREALTDEEDGLVIKLVEWDSRFKSLLRHKLPKFGQVTYFLWASDIHLHTGDRDINNCEVLRGPKIDQN